MEQFLCHIWGDFMLQNSYMALNKYKSWTPAIAHGIIYTFPFWLLTQDLWKLAAIAGIHIVIDHYRVAGWWARVVNQKWTEPQPVIPAWCITAIDQTMHLTINYFILR